jgi:hypothetical protein
VNCYLPCCRQLLICHLLSAFYYRLSLQKIHYMESNSLLPLLSPVGELACLLLLQALFTKSSHGDSSLLLPPFPVHSEHPAPSAMCPFQYLIYHSVLFFCGMGVSLSRGLCWFIPGVAVVVPRAAYLLTCWSESPKQIWSWHLAAWETSCFLSVMWCGETLCRLRVQGVTVSLFLGGFFLTSVAPASQQNFWFMVLMLSASSL